ncbi:root phototropism protein 3 [Brachypodium distachyon]|uniref:NPH3 domain-containing protein n=1 Tax=Brachypodium distachyon TaxID=15368 RepID=A0A0Q3IRI5_BRADI|nr:root phototropism protein 3 [Brachypodium distachyon]KQK02980.1 hypothetical protein BRADI_2g04767v3 [Brachypodium distachyon]|eukprot:XP_003565412.1 root phototropism protein 3 [Brachypodium distachyon]
MKSSSRSQSPKRAPLPWPRAILSDANVVAAEHAPPSSFSEPPPPPWLPAIAGRDGDTCASELDAFALAVASAKSSSTSRPYLQLAAVLSQYAATWHLTDVASSARHVAPDHRSPTAAWLQKRLRLETLVAALPPDPDPNPSGNPEPDDGITCDFLLRLLRAGRASGADAALIAALEARAARRLGQAALPALMMPVTASGHSATLLDVPLVLRLARGFYNSGGGGAAKAAARVARLVDAYLAEAALEAGLTHGDLEELARAVPAHARAADDALYRAVNTYLKAHPSTGKEARKSLWGLIDARKLSAEAAAHAVRNDRLPVRSALQVLFSDHGKLNRLADLGSAAAMLDLPGGGRRPSKPDRLPPHQEARRLREDVASLKLQCSALQDQVERLSSERRRCCGGFRWSTSWCRQRR